LRLKNEKTPEVIITDADINTWFPGDNLYDDGIFIPRNISSGEYELQIAVVDVQSHQPKVKLAIQGIDHDGWYPLGKIDIR
jgi:hypothetical protein